MRKSFIASLFRILFVIALSVVVYYCLAHFPRLSEITRVNFLFNGMLVIGLVHLIGSSQFFDDTLYNFYERSYWDVTPSSFGKSNDTRDPIKLMRYPLMVGFAFIVMYKIVLFTLLGGVGASLVYALSVELITSIVLFVGWWFISRSMALAVVNASPFHRNEAYYYKQIALSISGIISIVSFLCTPIAFAMTR